MEPQVKVLFFKSSIVYPQNVRRSSGRSNIIIQCIRFCRITCCYHDYMGPGRCTKLIEAKENLIKRIMIMATFTRDRIFLDPIGIKDCEHARVQEGHANYALRCVKADNR